MEFIHQAYQPDETIAAVATAPGEGGVAIIRISGKEAVNVAAKIFSGPVATYPSHTVHYGHVVDLQGRHIDSGLIIPMLGKRSYTGEDTVEIHCHGGHIITRRVLETVLSAGARAAKPGEFTFRAFMNGKLDLAQAEAVQELVCAKNEYALDAAEKQLQGSLSQKISQFQHQLTQIAAILEAWIDFPEEGLEFATMEDLCAELEQVSTEMNKLLSTFHDGRIIQEGISLCLIGRPNVGKSSLMNALLDKDRAIVSHIPGTTRDLLEDSMRINGLNIKLIDTAGIRDTSEAIEQEGIRRSKSAMGEADLILMVLDAHQGFHHEDQHLIQTAIPSKTIVAWNKIDLAYQPLPKLDFPHVLELSAKEKRGIDLLKEKIDHLIWNKGSSPNKEEIMITNIRHKEALSDAIESCLKVVNGLQEGLSPEFLSMDMRHSLSELGKIMGTNISEDILSAIFSKFCIGK